jgi:hypothetical protein
MLGDVARPMVGRGLAWGDLDGDGALDVAIGAVAGAPLVARNAASVGRHLDIALVDPLHPGNRQAIGAAVTLRLADGRTLQRTVMPNDVTTGASRSMTIERTASQR